MDFNHYFTNQEIETLINEWAETYPDLVTLSNIGKSHENRPVWVLTLTNCATGGKWSTATARNNSPPC